MKTTITEAPDYCIDEKGIVFNLKTDKKVSVLNNAVRLTVDGNRKAFKVAYLRETYIEAVVMPTEAAVKKPKEIKTKKDKTTAPKTLSRSQEIYIYFSEGLDAKTIQEKHSDWSLAHIKNAIRHAKNNKDAVKKSLKIKDEN